MGGQKSTSWCTTGDLLNKRLAAYLAAAGGGAAVAAEAEAAIVANTATQPFGVNGEVNIDFNQDGQIDFQIDHDRYNLNGTELDYLQLDKNDVNGAANPLPMDGAATFPPGDTMPNDAWEAGYAYIGFQGAYPAALPAGTPIGPELQTFDFQEGDNFLSGGQTIRANRLIDEDQTQIDQVVGGLGPEQVYVPTDGPNFLGLNGEVRYLGVKMELNGTDLINYGWIGIRIDNEADATGAVVGYAYESEPGVAINAGDTGPFVANADFDDDGDVDGGDFLLWQQQFGSSVGAGTGADGNGDGSVNGGDLALWKSSFGEGATMAVTEAGVAAVPEPASLGIGGLGGVIVLGWSVLFARKRKARRSAS